MSLGNFFIIFILLGLFGCIQTETAGNYRGEKTASSIFASPNEGGNRLFDRKLKELKIPKDIRQFRQVHLNKCRVVYQEQGDSINSIIAYGKALAAMGNMNSAIDVFNRGLVIYPESHRLLRYRGHAYLMLRKLNNAIEDLKNAAYYSRGKNREFDFPGFETSSYTNRFTIRYNIYYYLGVSFYIKGNYDKAVSSFKKCLDVSFNGDLKVGAIDWLYMTYRRIGNMELANAQLKYIDKKTKVSFFYAHLYNILLYKQMRSPKQLVKYFENYEYEGNSATQLYGLGSWYLHSGDLERATALLEQAVGELNWNNSGVLAAEADLFTLKSNL